ncbi:hypothetical protein BJX99DRAFT_258003 [Aspergillus californicus]
MDAVAVESDIISNEIVFSPRAPRPKREVNFNLYKTPPQSSKPSKPPIKPPRFAVSTDPSQLPMDDLSFQDSNVYSDYETLDSEDSKDPEDSPSAAISSVPGPPSTPASLGPKELWSTMYPNAEDEQIVNSALVNFLIALTAPYSIECVWTCHRKAFKPKFKSTQYEARVDGYLKYRKSSQALALIEVESSIRDNKIDEIQMQEAAQMVAWLKTSPKHL